MYKWISLLTSIILRQVRNNYAKDKGLIKTQPSFWEIKLTSKIYTAKL